MANDKEPYHATISRLINENRELKQRIESYNHEKQSFMDTINVLTNAVNTQDKTLNAMYEHMENMKDEKYVEKMWNELINENKGE